MKDQNPNERRVSYHDEENRRTKYFLQRGGFRKSSKHPPTSRIPFFLPDVSIASTRFVRQFPYGCAKLPGFGHCDAPSPKNFAYTFDHIASVIDDLTEMIGLSRYTPYMQDYCGPVGFRIALAHPERIDASIVQDAVSHSEGPGRRVENEESILAGPS
jgi:pimeloyl-ACP methyl ester carboxylesterase